MSLEKAKAFRKEWKARMEEMEGKPLSREAAERLRSTFTQEATLLTMSFPRGKNNSGAVEIMNAAKSDLETALAIGESLYPPSEPGADRDPRPLRKKIGGVTGKLTERLKKLRKS